MRRLALLGLLVLALAAGAWWVARPARRALGLPPQVSTGVDRSTADLEAARATGEHASELVQTATAAEDEHASRERAALGVPYGPLRGRLVRGDGDGVAESLHVLLASDGNRVVEALNADPGGAFVSTRRFPRGPLRAFVSDPGSGARRARHAAEFDPEAPGEWLVPVPDPARIVYPTERRTEMLGRVVSPEREGVVGVRVRLIRLGEEGGIDETTTGAGGRFFLPDLDAGPHRLRLQGRFAPPTQQDVVVRPGLNDLGAVVLPIAPARGTLSGRLRIAGHDESLYFLRLRDLKTGREIAQPTEWELFQQDDGEVAFEIHDVPAGEYELSVVGDVEFEPARMRVSPPTHGLEFRTVVGQDRRYRLRAVDARSGVDLERATVATLVEGQWIGSDVELDDDLEPLWSREWLVFTAQHRPVRTTVERARRVACNDEHECFELIVELEPGHGQAFVFKDLESDQLVVTGWDEPFFSPGRADVRILADGVLVATSDADGLALVDLPRAPRTVAFELPGWRVVDEEGKGGLRYVYMERE